MADLSIVAGASKQSHNIFIQDTRVGTGAGLTGLVFNSAGLTAYYSFAGVAAASVAVTLATLSAVNSGYSSGGFKEIDATNMPGWYRFDMPDAALVAGKGREVSFHLQGASNMAPRMFSIELTGWDNQDGVRGGMTSVLSQDQITEAVWDRVASEHQIEGTFGLAIGDPGSESNTIYDLVNQYLDASVKSRSSQASQDAIALYLSTYLDVTVSSRLATSAGIITLSNILSALGLTSANLATLLGNLPGDVADAVWDEDLEEHDSGASTNLKEIQSTVESRASQVSLNELTVIVEGDTTDLSEVLDAIDDVQTTLDAVRTKTDSLTFSVPLALDCNITHVNYLEVDGSGTSNDPWGPA